MNIDKSDFIYPTVHEQSTANIIFGDGYHD